jgi:dTDP-4-dehydrorhamnose reductase
MKAVITGANGTIGSKLKSHLEEQGHTVVGWNRQEVPINDYWAMENFLKAESPDVVYHLAIPSNPTGHENESWMVNYQWTSELAWISKVLGISFIFSSTVMVFTNNAKGPFRPDMSPDAVEGYGYEKRMAEERVFYQNPGARIVRLGWQIGDAPGSNNMVDFLDTRMKSDGLVSASTEWLPACSFLEDTVQVLAQLPDMDPGLYHFDSNEKWTFYQIAFALNTLQGKKWKIVPSENFVYDQRMEDERLPRFSLKDRLKSLK